MPEVSLEQAAIVLGVSVDTVRRRIRLGQLPAHRDGGGRRVVTVPAAPVLPDDVERLRQHERDQVEALQRDNAHLAELVAELRRQLQGWELQNEALREQLRSAGEAQRELHRLLAQAQEQIAHLLHMREPRAG